MRELSKAVVGSVLTHDCKNLEKEPKVEKIEAVEEIKPKDTQTASEANKVIQIFVIYSY